MTKFRDKLEIIALPPMYILETKTLINTIYLPFRKIRAVRPHQLPTTQPNPISLARFLPRVYSYPGDRRN